MRSKFLWAAALVALAVPHSVAGQAFGVAARAGTLGIGAEGALGVGNRLVVRGGLGLLPIEVDGTFDDIDMTVELPRTWYNLGVDLYLTGVLRVGGGLLFKSDDVTLTATPTTSQDIGGQQFTPAEIGSLVGTLDSGKQAPYVLVGFGKHTSSGIGLTLDLGVAFQKETRVTLDAEGGTLSDDPSFQDRLDQEAQDFQDDLPKYIDLWPILNLGLRIGVGR